MPDDVAILKRWVDTWKETGVELEKRRAEELAAMTDSAARAILQDLMALVDTAYRSPLRREHSGLVEQQAIFQRRARA